MNTLPQWAKMLNQLGEKHTPCFFVINYQGTSGEVFPLSALPKDILFSFSEEKAAVSDPILIEKHPIPYPIFEKSFQKVFSHLEKGDTALINLTFATEIGAVDLNKVYQNAKAKYKILYKDEWVCFSPEIFVKIEADRIKTYPMKGTISATLPDAESLLLNNPKEIDEHKKVVALLSTDLAHVATDIHVSKFRYIDVIEKSTGNLLQTSSEIIGTLQSDWQAHLGEILAKLLPAGSICGTPREKTMEIIRQAETYHRGYYTGIAGIFDGESLDTCVLIRFIERIGGKFYYKSGAGITAQSKPESEYKEILEKIYIPN